MSDEIGQSSETTAELPRLQESRAEQACSTPFAMVMPVATWSRNINAIREWELLQSVSYQDLFQVPCLPVCYIWGLLVYLLQFLAAMSSSRSDIVTPSVRLSVGPSNFFLFLSLKESQTH